MKTVKYVELAGVTLLAGLMGCSVNGTQTKNGASKSPAASPVRPPEKPSAELSSEKQQNQDRQRVRIQELSAREESGQTIIDLKLSAPISRYRHFPVAQPPRIVVDIFADMTPAVSAEAFLLNTNHVGTLRLSHGEGYLRLSIDSVPSTVPAYVITPEGNGIKLTVGVADPKAAVKRHLILMRDGKRVHISTGEVTPARETAAQPGAKEQVALEREKYTGQKLSLDFKDADIKNVFRLLGEVSGKNVVVTDDVNRKVTIRLVDVPWDQALDILIQTHGLGKEEVGNVIRISTTARLKADRDAANALAASKKSGETAEELQVAYLTVNYARVVRGKDDGDSADKDLVDKVKTVLSPRGSVVADQRTNTLVVRDIRKGIEDAQTLLAKLDTRTPQVLIESNLIETTPTYSRALGIELDTIFNNGRVQTSGRFRADAPFSGAPVAIFPPNTSPIVLPESGFRFGYFGNNIAAILSAAEEQGHLKIISRPSVVTLNNVESTIESSETIRVKTAAATVGESGSIQTFKAGVILTVTPQVSADGYVLLKIAVKNSAFDFTNDVDGIPRETAREAKANILVRDGETVVIGGIMKDTSTSSESGVPYLKDVPVLGWLFKKTSSEKNLDEMVVFITPRILTAAADDLPTAEQIWREQLNKTQGDKSTSVPVTP